MLFLGLRVSLNAIERILMTIIALYEFMIVLRVILNWLQRFNILAENRFSFFLTRVTEPVLSPIRETLFRITGFSGFDLSPVVAIALGELLQWIIKLIF